MSLQARVKMILKTSSYIVIIEGFTPVVLEAPIYWLCEHHKLFLACLIIYQLTCSKPLRATNWEQYSIHLKETLAYVERVRQVLSHFRTNFFDNIIFQIARKVTGFEKCLIMHRSIIQFLDDSKTFIVVSCLFPIILSILP